MSKTESDEEADGDGDESQQVVFAAGNAGHALEKLAAIENSDAVQKHDQPDQADRPRDLRLGGEGADRKPDEQHRADAERETAEIDLTDEIAEADGKKGREDRLRPDDFPRKIKHPEFSLSLSILSS